MSKIGRPTIEESQRKQTILTLRLSEDEHKQLEQFAISKGRKLSSVAREILLANVQQATR